MRWQLCPCAHGAVGWKEVLGVAVRIDRTERGCQAPAVVSRSSQWNRGALRAVLSLALCHPGVAQLCTAAAAAPAPAELSLPRRVLAPSAGSQIRLRSCQVQQCWEEGAGAGVGCGLCAVCWRHSEHGGGSSSSLRDHREPCGTAVGRRAEKGWGEPFPAARVVGARGVSGAQTVLCNWSSLILRETMFTDRVLIDLTS